MARKSRIKRTNEEDETELNMVPIMNMFMVLIPFLLMSASFFQIRVINTSAPVHAQSSESAAPKTEIEKVTIVLELNEKQVRISALSDSVSSEVLDKLEATFSRTPGSELETQPISEYLMALKNKYPASDTLLLIPELNVSYNEIVQTMDCARLNNDNSLFPNVVISASLG